MSKYYIAEVTVVTRYEVRISTSNETDPEKDATEKAKRAATDQNSRNEISSHIGNVELRFDGETNFEIGQKIKHHVFGVGVINDLKRTTNCNNEIGEMATIQFEDGSEKRIGLSLIADKIEIIE